MKLLYLLIMFVFLSYLPTFQRTHAQIYINEFAVDPSPQTVEIVNESSASADISGWYIDDNGGTTFYTIPQQTILPPSSCKLFSSDFNLNKLSPDSIRLFDSSAPPTSSTAHLIDSFSYKTATTSGSYQKIPDGSAIWVTDTSSFGLWNSTKTTCTAQLPTPTAAESLQTTPSPTPTPTMIQSYGNIVISEVMAQPLLPETEWVEIYNGNNFAVELIDWYIDDVKNAGSSPLLFSAEIPAYGYTFITTSSMFNNDGDTIRLLDSQLVEQDVLSYISSEIGISFIKNDDGVCNSAVTTKGTVNKDCGTETTIIDPTITPVSELIQMRPVYKPISIKPTIIIHISLPPVLKPSNNSDGSILGDYTVKETTPALKALGKSLNFTSFSFSLLTILKLFLRMKSHV